MDRIDLHVEVTPVPFEELDGPRQGEGSAQVRERVVAARRQQAARFGSHPQVHCNAQMGTRLVKAHCQLGPESRSLLKMAIERMGMSARAYTRILKVARTIADLREMPDIRAEDVSEAIQYRTLDRDWWHG
jgi:magnesium chelatase family protein